MEYLPRICFKFDKYPYINQLLVDQPDLYVEMNTKALYNTFVACGYPEPVYRWVLDKQVKLFRQGLEVAVFNREDLESGLVKVTFRVQFPKPNSKISKI